MPWQDFVIGTGSVLFIIALIPTILSNDKPRWETASITAFVLYSFSVAYATLDLKFATITAIVTGLLWTIIAVEAYKFQKGTDF